MKTILALIGAVTLWVVLLVATTPEPKPHVWCLMADTWQAKCIMYSTLSPSEYANYESIHVIDLRSPK